MKHPVCFSLPGPLEEHGKEKLVFCLPIKDGYIGYSMIHSVKPSIQCNVWRMGPVDRYSDSLSVVERLTKPGAEWEMAIRLDGRPDFIGGVAHGDEVMEGASFSLDGKAVTPSELTAPTTFCSAEICVDSIGYDPSIPTTPVLKHHKQICFDACGVTVLQRVEWLGEYPLGVSYMAMMPPLKTVTDWYCTNLDETRIPLTPKDNLRKTEPIKTLTLGKTQGLRFSMTAEYPSFSAKENTYLVSDNGGLAYNKMYFVLPHGRTAEKGEIFETRTDYRIREDNEEKDRV